MANIDKANQTAAERMMEAVQVDWRPPAAGNEDLMSILEKMKA